MPQFDTTFFQSQIFWTMLSFLVLYVLIKRWIVPIITATLDKRVQQIETEIANANQAREDMEAMKARYAEQIVQADKEVEQMFKDAEARISAKREESLHDLEEEIQKKRQLLVQDEAVLREHLLHELRHDSSAFIMAATERILEQKWETVETEEMLKHVIEELEHELDDKSKQTKH